MTAADKMTIRGLVKTRLNRLTSDTSLDDYLSARIDAAIGELEGTGIHLRSDTDDMLLVTDYTCWAYSNRDSGAGMPDWMRLRRRERWLQEHGAGESA